MQLPADAPIAPRRDHHWQRPTGDVHDPWAWLRDRDDPETIAYLEAENAWSDRWFAEHSDTVDAIFGEIKRRVLETDTAVPTRKGPWWYVSRTQEGASYAIHCRGESAERATDTVILDENVEAGDHDYFSLNAFDIGNHHDLLAYSVDLDGSERYTLRIRDLRTGADLADEIADTTWGGTAWSADDRYLFYVTPDEQMRPHQVWRHLLGTAQGADVLVFDEPDERFFVSVELSRSGDWIIIEAQSKLSSEALLLDARSPEDLPSVVRRRTDDLEYSVEHWGDRFVIVTNLDAEDFQVMTAPLDDPASWTPLVAHEQGRRIVGVEPFAEHLVIHEWLHAQPQLRVLFRDGDERTLHITDEPHDVELGAMPEWDTSTIRLNVQSCTMPATVYDEDARTGERVLRKQTPVLDTDLSQYVSSREWATADDGTRIPVDVVRHRDVQADGTAACVVYAYGSYEISMPPWFSVARLSLLDRGVVWALAHPRGGGELGRRWYLDGKLQHKRNTFTDTIAVADHLVASRWAAADRLAVRGGSAGGLLVGACITMQPELFSAAVAEVPFVDVVSTMSDPTLPLTVTEWEEWGDPRSEPAASYIASYSPYDNTVAASYPALLVTAGLNDPRVSFHEPAKWVAKLRSASTSGRTLLLRTEMGAGHGGPSGRYDAWRDEARVLTFLLAELDRSRR
jgi:oligopeptidase B